MQPPKAVKIPYSYEIHGQKINDEYSWLRDKDWPVVKDPKILSYLKEENAYFDNYFKPLENFKEKIFEELKGRIQLTDQSTYVKKDNYFYYSRTEADKQYPIYCRKEGNTNAAEEIILDVNKLAEGKVFTKIDALSVSPDHKLLAYSVDFSGEEKYTIKIFDLTVKKLLSDDISGTMGDVVWHEKISGFFYTPMNDKWRADKVMFHKLGDKVADDKLVKHETDILFQLSVGKTGSKKFILINSGGHTSNELYFLSMEDSALKPQMLLQREENVYFDADHNGDYFYIKTNKNAKNFKVIRINIAQIDTGKASEDFIPESELFLSDFDITQKYLILNYRKLGLDAIKIMEINSRSEKDISFPDSAYVASGGSTNFEENDIRVTYSSLNRPNITYNYDFEHGTLSILKEQKIPSGFNSDEYQVERLFADTDGVRVPITVFYKKSFFKKDGSNPLYLYGYGSYGYNLPANFRNIAVTIADRGFVFALAHIRGGNDLGQDWYESAKFLNKKRTFNDFMATAEHLIKEKYTSSGKITICGGSAGGLLIGYFLNHKPELLKVAIAHVPYVDVINSMLDETIPLTPGEFKEWGNPKEKEYFDYMLSYSPYDHVKPTNFPAILLTAGLSDPRVGYWESAKWLARLRDNNTGSNIMVLKTNMSAGHGGASGRFDYLKETAEELVFMFNIYGINE